MLNDFFIFCLEGNMAPFNLINIYFLINERAKPFIWPMKEEGYSSCCAWDPLVQKVNHHNRLICDLYLIHVYWKDEIWIFKSYNPLVHSS